MKSDDLEDRGGQISWNKIWWYNMGINGVKLDQVGWYGFELDQINSDEIGWYKMILNAIRWDQIESNWIG